MVPLPFDGGVQLAVIFPDPAVTDTWGAPGAPDAVAVADTDALSFWKPLRVVDTVTVALVPGDTPVTVIRPLDEMVAEPAGDTVALHELLDA